MADIHLDPIPDDHNPLGLGEHREKRNPKKHKPEPPPEGEPEDWFDPSTPDEAA
jgi:hypothetical protein